MSQSGLCHQFVFTEFQIDIILMSNIIFDLNYFCGKLFCVMSIMKIILITKNLNFKMNSPLVSLLSFKLNTPTHA